MTDGLGLMGHTALLAIAALFPIVDPIAGAPIFLELTGSLDQRKRAVLARMVAWNSFLLLLASMLAGAYVLEFFGLSIPAVQIAGGFVLAAMGWSLLNKAEATDAAERATAGDAAADSAQRRAFYPLTMPLTVGPGSISVAITLGANPSEGVRTLLLTATGHALGALAVAVSVYFCYRYAHALVRVLGETGRTVVARLSAFLLLCIGVQIASNGVLAMLAGR